MTLLTPDSLTNLTFSSLTASLEKLSACLTECYDLDVLWPLLNLPQLEAKRLLDTSSLQLDVVDALDELVDVNQLLAEDRG